MRSAASRVRLAGWLKALPATAFYTVHVRRNRIGQPQRSLPSPQIPSATRGRRLKSQNSCDGAYAGMGNSSSAATDDNDWGYPRFQRNDRVRIRNLPRDEYLGSQGVVTQGNRERGELVTVRLEINQTKKEFSPVNLEKLDHNASRPGCEIVEIVHAKGTTRCKHVLPENAKAYWRYQRRNNQAPWPTTCCMLTKNTNNGYQWTRCREKDDLFNPRRGLVGAHVFGPDNEMYIVPCCRHHNSEFFLKSNGHVMRAPLSMMELVRDCNCQDSAELPDRIEVEEAMNYSDDESSGVFDIDMCRVCGKNKGLGTGAKCLVCLMLKKKTDGWRAARKERERQKELFERDRAEYLRCKRADAAAAEQKNQWEAAYQGVLTEFDLEESELLTLGFPRKSFENFDALFAEYKDEGLDPGRFLKIRAETAHQKKKKAAETQARSDSPVDFTICRTRTLRGGWNTPERIPSPARTRRASLVNLTRRNSPVRTRRSSPVRTRDSSPSPGAREFRAWLNSERFERGRREREKEERDAREKEERDAREKERFERDLIERLRTVREKQERRDALDREDRQAIVEAIVQNLQEKRERSDDPPLCRICNYRPVRKQGKDRCRPCQKAGYVTRPRGRY